MSPTETQRIAQRLEIADAIRWWIDRQIEKGLTNDEIVARAPLAIAFIAGTLSLDDVLQKLQGG